MMRRTDTFKQTGIISNAKAEKNCLYVDSPFSSTSLKKISIGIHFRQEIKLRVLGVFQY